ncbi:MAG: hypothetical protein QXT16_08445 [Candidatus Caldarchaeum sp.]
MGLLLSEFERWLKDMGYNEEIVRDITRVDWESSLLDRVTDYDLEIILYYTALFALRKVFGENVADKGLKWIFVERSEISNGYMMISILEIKTRTVVAYIEDNPVEMTPRHLEDVLKNLIDQIREAEKILAVRIIVDS